MSLAQFLEHLKEMSDVERLEVIEAATRLIRTNLDATRADRATGHDERMRVAAASVKDLYECANELSEWTAL